MTTDEMLFWDAWEGLLPLYEAIRAKVLARYPETRVKVSKSQISFYNRHMFSMVSPPAKRRKEWPRSFILLSFGLPEPVESARVAMKVEAYPGRWTHHMLIQRAEDVDGEALEWLDRAYAFAESKR